MRNNPRIPTTPILKTYFMESPFSKRETLSSQVLYIGSMRSPKLRRRDPHDFPANDIEGIVFGVIGRQRR
jgi:hypothetical protein